MNAYVIARVAHEINRAYCEATGDQSQPIWEDAPEWHRQSIVNGVQFILANPQVHPSTIHQNWLSEKLRDGWRYGPIKDPEQKEHPCMVPYEELPREQQMKDYLFRAVVVAVAVALSHE